MSKQTLIKKLASFYGIIPEYFDAYGKLHKVTYNECIEFLKVLNINLDTQEDLEDLVNKIEFQQWSQWIPPVQVIKQGQMPVVQMRVSKKQLSKTFEWILIEENGSRHSAPFSTKNLSMSIYKSFKKRGTFYQFALPLPVMPDLGYHTVIIKGEHSKEAKMKLIVAPEKCYIPPGIINKHNIKGPEIKLDSQKHIDHANYRFIKTIIKNITSEKADIVAVGQINNISVRNLERNKSLLPSSRLIYNILYLNVDDIASFLEEKSAEIDVLINELHESIKTLQENENYDLKEVYSLKLKVLKKLYQSFREYHLNVNSPKRKEFEDYIEQKGENLRKLSLFEALQEFFDNEYAKFTNWHEWPESYRNPDSEFVKSFENNNIELIQFYDFLQWQADIQLGEAGYFSYLQKLSVGVYVNLPSAVDPYGSETWLHQDYFAFGARIKSKSSFDESNDPDPVSCPVLPHKLYESAYEYFIKYLKPNMNHAGAIKISNFEAFDYQQWFVNEDFSDDGFYIKYPLEDLMGILALESHRNRCLIVSREYANLSPKIKQLILQYGIYTENAMDLGEISSLEEAKKLYGSAKLPVETEAEGEFVEIRYPEEAIISKIPDCTYRLQFNQNFTFRNAAELIPYLKELGISHCYASPLLCARENSTHGYDIINHNAFNPSLGSKEDFYYFVNQLRKNDMGLIVDIVPNHMGISKENHWWMDVLENGPASEYSEYFDIDWEPLKPELKNKVLVPVLGEHYGNILASGQLKFKFSRNTGKIIIYYYEHEFPVNPSSYAGILSYREEVLASRLGSSNPDFLEYKSIITEFKNLPANTEKNPELLRERKRETDIALKRLSKICQSNYVIEEFIKENLYDFQPKPEDPVSHVRMHNLLEEQAYRLAYWRVSSDEINYRRFFDVNDLAGISVEIPAVFTNTHRFIFELIEQRQIDGLRIDHPDGLFNPAQYFYRLQEEAARRLGISFNPAEETLCGNDRLPIYVVVEKILAPFERLPENWAVSGSVGYEFLNAVNNLFICKDNDKKLSKIYSKFINNTIDFHEMVVECKKLIMKSSLTGELNVLSNYINKISESYYISRDYTLNSLRNALEEIIAHFPVYRTYISEKDKTSKDIDYIKWAVGAAKKRSFSTDPAIFDFIEKILIAEFEDNKESSAYQEILKFAMKFQQYTGPLMAKGLEDTSFYRYNRLISINEVGGEPANFGLSVYEFHQQNIARFNYCPHNMLNSSTHDTKRSEDVRARISVLSEIPELWQKKVNRWSQLNKMKKSRVDKSFYPDKNDEYLFYQTLIGIWPGKFLDKDELDAMINRIEQYMLKAIREAKNHTSWLNINQAYEDAICNFIRRVLTSPEKHPFWKEFISFQQEIILRGYLNSISQCVLKFTCPGVPDIYQGNELFDFSLVDPDNRRPVNYQHSQHMLDQVKSLIHLNLENKNIEPTQFHSILMPLESGAMKIFITAATLKFRNAHSDLFKYGNYIPLQTEGEKAENIVAFIRKYKGEAIIVIVPRLMYSLVSKDNILPVSSDLWKDTKVIIPEEYKHYNWSNIYTKEYIADLEVDILAGKLLNILPVAVIFGEMQIEKDNKEDISFDNFETTENNS